MVKLIQDTLQGKIKRVREKERVKSKTVCILGVHCMIVCLVDNQ